MPLTDEFEGLGDEARTVLPSDERLLVLTSVDIAFGSTGRHDPDFGESKTGRRLLGRARRASDAVEHAKVPGWLTRVGLVIGGLFSWAPSWPDPWRLYSRMIGGEVVTAEPDSMARVVQAQLPPYGSAHYLAITDQRLYLLDPAPVLSKRMISEEPPAWSAPTSIVANAQPAPRGLARARFALVFTDRSRLVLTVFPSHSTGAMPRRVVAAIRQVPDFRTGH